LNFDNEFPKEPIVRVMVPLYGSINLGDANNGLCGGMVYTVRDFFDAGRATPDNPAGIPPAEGSAMFNYIAARLIESFDLPNGVALYFKWMNLPDADAGMQLFGRHVVIERGLAWRTIVEELPKVKADIDAGHPSPIGLVTVRSRDPKKLGENHQVMAHAYAIDDANRLTLRIYDPNQDGTDTVTISMSLANPTGKTPIDHNVAIGNPIRGFFHSRYTRRDPTQALDPT
jgi:hypothetical protein